MVGFGIAALALAIAATLYGVHGATYILIVGIALYAVAACGLLAAFVLRTERPHPPRRHIAT